MSTLRQAFWRQVRKRPAVLYWHIVETVRKWIRRARCAHGLHRADAKVWRGWNGRRVTGQFWGTCAHCKKIAPWKGSS